MQELQNSVTAFAEMIKKQLEQRYPDCTILVREVMKNNDTLLTGITIIQEGCNISPSIYINQHYAQYLQGRSVADISNEVADIYECSKVEHNVDMEEILSFERIKEKICFKLVNTERNKEMLQTIPYRMYQDLAVVYYILLEKCEMGSATLMISDDMLNSWGVGENTLYRYAVENTPRLLAGEVVTMKEILAELLGKDTGISQEESEDDGMYVATNTDRSCGAAVILYAGFLKDFASKQRSDFYILPSSLHEVLFLPVSEKLDAEELAEMVKEINETQVAPDEVLSDHVYRYYTETDCVRLVA